MEPTASRFEITEIHLWNIRGFRELALNVRDGEGRPRKRTLVVGKNGTCKSALLRAIAIGLADYTDASRLISEPFGGLVTAYEAEPDSPTSGFPTPGSIRIRMAGLEEASQTIELGKELTRDNDGKETLTLSRERNPFPLVCGYGAGRYGAGPYSEGGTNYRLSDAVLTLFRYYQSLSHPELTLRRLKAAFSSELYHRILRNIQNALSLTEEDKIDILPAGGVVVSGPSMGGRVPLEGWADGYRLTFNWILDLYAWALQAGRIDEVGEVEGILLIDEIDQHLHPSMQAEILPRLSELLPKMQIFATTHSPLVALDATPEELIVLRRKGDRIVAEEDVPNFLGYTVEDMLADPRLFDSEVYGHETRTKLAEYRELASIPKEKRGDDQRHRLRSLATEIRSLEGYQESENETSRLLKQFMAKYDL